VLAVLAIGVCTLAVTAEHITSGSLYFDDYRAVEALRSHPELSTEAALAEAGLNVRPLQAPVWRATFDLLGLHTAKHLAWISATAAMTGVALFLLLIALGLRHREALAPSVLLVLFPWADSQRLWPSMAAANLALSAVLLGAALSVVALRRHGRGSLPWHAGGLVLYAAGVMLYEQVVGLVAVASVAYLLRAPWKRAAARSAADVAVAGGALAISLGGGLAGRKQPDVAGAITHAGTISEQALEVLGRSVAPWGVPWQAGLAAIGLVLAASVTALVRRRRTERSSFARPLLAAALGIVVMVAGYAPMVPASDWYAPLQPGNGNRTNASAAIGFVVVVCAVALLAGHLLAAALRRAAAGPWVAAALAAAVGIGWGLATLGDARAWDRASVRQEVVLRGIEGALGRPPAGAQLFVFGAPRSTRPEVPVFLMQVDLTAALRLRFRGSDVDAVPVFEDSAVSCAATGPHLAGGLAEPAPMDYTATWFVDAAAGRAERVPDAGTCERLLPAFPRGPLALEHG
jgi:hypothetical protein